MNKGERLKYLRKTLKMTQKDFGEKIGLKANTVSDIENGKYNLKEASIKLACSEFKVDYMWLTTGEGEMFSNNKDDEDYLAKIDYIMTGENNFHKNLFKTFASLSEDELETLEKIIDRFLEIKKESE